MIRVIDYNGLNINAHNCKDYIVGMEDKQIINVRSKLFYNNKAERDCCHHQQVDYEVVCYWA